MTDHNSEVGSTGKDAESNTAASYSTNGSDPTGAAYESEELSVEGSGDGTDFLAELARAMQSTAAAEQARNAEGTEQRRQSHIDAIRAREAIEAEELRELAKEDVKGIDAWSDGEIKRIKLERERRIAARREQLQIRLEEHRTVIGREVEHVEAAVAAYRADIEQYFRRLESETDPVAIAQYAGTRPPFPTLEEIGPDGVPGAAEYSQVLSDPVVEAPIAVAAPIEPIAPEEAPASFEGPAGQAEPTDETAAEPVEATAEQVEATAEPDEAAPIEDDQPGAVEGEPVAAEGESPLVGVMDPEATSEPTADKPWDAGSSDAVAAEATGDAQADATDTAAEATEGSEEEPVAALAEARVVMPRSTSAGSWLRWPNNSGPSDPGH